MSDVADIINTERRANFFITKSPSGALHVHCRTNLWRMAPEARESYFKAIHDHDLVAESVDFETYNRDWKHLVATERRVG